MHIHPFAVASLPPINHYQPENSPLLVGANGGAWMAGPSLVDGELALGQDQLESGCGFFGFII